MPVDPRGQRPTLLHYVLIDETIGETVYALDGPRSLLEGRIGDLVQVHGMVVETERNIPLLEVTRVD